MLTDRIIGAFTFRKGVYAEVEHDTTFTQTAWIIVAVVAFLNQVGANASTDFLSWLVRAVGGTLFAIAGFAVGAYVINVVGRSLFNADVTFDELVRTLGLAYVWSIIGFIGVVAAFIPYLGCLLAPILIASFVAMIIAWFIATKEALDLEWGPTIGTVIIGFVVMLVIAAIGGVLLGALGFGAAAIGGAIN
jgi:hypothetical protein